MKKNIILLLAACLFLSLLCSCSKDDENSGNENAKSDLTGMKLFFSRYEIDDEGFPYEDATTLTFKTSSTGHYYCHGSDYIWDGRYKQDFWTVEWDFKYTWDGKVLSITSSKSNEGMTFTLYYVDGNFCNYQNGDEPWICK